MTAKPADWIQLAREHLFDFIPLGQPPSMRHALERAVEDGTNFKVRRLAKCVLEISAEDRLPFAAMLTDVAAESPKNATRLRPLFLYVCAELEPNQLEYVLRGVFDAKVTEWYPDLLAGHQFQPSAETWPRIWPQIAEQDSLLGLVIGNYGLFQTPPPLTVEHAFAGGFRRDMAPLLRSLVRAQVDGVGTLWAGLVTHLEDLSADEREDLFSALAVPRLERLFALPGFAAQVRQTLSRADLRASAAYGSFWDELMAAPEPRLVSWAQQPDYPALLDQVFTSLCANYTEPFAARLALFLGKVPYEAKIFGAHRADLRRLESTADRTLAPLVREVLAREPVGDDKPARDELRKQLHTTDVEVVRLQIQAAEAAFREGLAQIQSANLPAAETARLIQQTANEYRERIAVLTASLQKPA